MGGLNAESGRGRVLVTPRSLSHGHPCLDRLTAAGFELVFPSPGETPREDQLRAALPHCVAYLAGIEQIDGDLLATASQLQVIARNGTGVDNIDLHAAEQHGIRVRAAAGANSRGVAELAIALLLAASRHISWSDAQLKHEQWNRRVGAELGGRTVGVVGLGAIGRTVAELAAGLGMRVLGQDRITPAGWQPPAGFEQTSMERLLAESDLLTLHIPGGDRPLVDAAFLDQVRPGAVLVNTARGDLVDTAALLAALDSRRLSAYAVDAFVQEPPTDWRIVGHEHVIATPHIGGLTSESVQRAAEAAVTAILEELGAHAPV